MTYRTTDDQMDRELSRQRCEELADRCVKLELELAFRDIPANNGSGYPHVLHEENGREFWGGLGVGISWAGVLLLGGANLASILSSPWILVALMLLLILGGMTVACVVMARR